MTETGFDLNAIVEGLFSEELRNQEIVKAVEEGLTSDHKYVDIAIKHYEEIREYRKAAHWSAAIGDYRRAMLNSERAYDLDLACEMARKAGDKKQEEVYKKLIDLDRAQISSRDMTYEPPGYSSFAQLLQYFREQGGMSQRNLPKVTGLSASHLNKVEKEERKPPKRRDILILANALCLDPDKSNELLLAAGYDPLKLDEKRYLNNLAPPDQMPASADLH